MTRNEIRAIGQMSQDGMSITEIVDATGHAREDVTRARADSKRLFGFDFQNSFVSDAERLVIRDMRNSGKTVKAIAEKLGRSQSNIHRHIKAMERDGSIKKKAPRSRCTYGSVSDAIDVMGEEQFNVLIAQAEKYGSTIAEVLAETWLDVYFSEKAKEGAHGGQFKATG